MKFNLRSFFKGKRLSAVIWFLRIAVGLVFLYSGFVKVVDPWGFIFKLEEYLALADIVFPRSITLLLSLGCSIFEFVAGLLLATGCYRRLVPISMTAFMLVMLPLTAYLYIADPIPDCGCFGDAVILTNGETFFKNVLLSAAVVALLFLNFRVGGLISKHLGWIVAGLGFIYSLALGIYGYNVQPAVDFRPYPEGRSLVQDNEGDEDNIRFVYRKGGVTKEFSADNLPDGDGWEFVERIEGDSGNDSYFAITDTDGEDRFPELIESGYDRGFFLLVIPEPEMVDISGTYYVNELASVCNDNNIGFCCAIAADSAGIEDWKDRSFADYEVYTAEDTSLKELVRGTMALVYVAGGKIIWKRTVSSVTDSFLDEISRTASAGKPLVTVLENRNEVQKRLLRFSTGFIGALLFLFIADRIYSLNKRKKSSESKADKGKNQSSE